ncbi:unnamed protein product, partial [Prorocentrum cordatum]
AVIVKIAASPVDVVVSTPLDLPTLPRSVVHPGLAILRQAFLIQLVSILCLKLANVTKKDLINYMSERLPATVTSAVQPPFTKFEKFIERRFAEQDQRICEISDDMDCMRKRGEAVELRMQASERELELARHEPRPTVARTSEWARKVDQSVFIIRTEQGEALGKMFTVRSPGHDGVAEKRVAQAHAQLCLGDGRWRSLAVQTPGERWAPLNISFDKSRQDISREIAVKKCRTALGAFFHKPVQADRDECILSV